MLFFEEEDDDARLFGVVCVCVCLEHDWRGSFAATFVASKKALSCDGRREGGGVGGVGAVAKLTGCGSGSV